MKISEELRLGGWAAKRRTRDSRVVVGNFDSQRGTLRRPTHNISSCRFRADPGQSSRGLIRWGRVKVGHHRQRQTQTSALTSHSVRVAPLRRFPSPRVGLSHNADLPSPFRWLPVSLAAVRFGELASTTALSSLFTTYYTKNGPSRCPSPANRSSLTAKDTSSVVSLRLSPSRLVGSHCRKLSRGTGRTGTSSWAVSLGNRSGRAEQRGMDRRRDEIQKQQDC